MEWRTGTCLIWSYLDPETVRSRAPEKLVNQCRVQLATIVGVVLLTSGCGVQQAQLDAQLSEVREIAEEALRTANTADYHAHQAKTMADEALTKQRMMKKKRHMKKMMK